MRDRQLDYTAQKREHAYQEQPAAYTQQYLDHLELLPLNVHTDHTGSFVGIQIKMQGVRSCLRACVSNKFPGEADAAGLWTLPWVERGDPTRHKKLL